MLVVWVRAVESMKRDEMTNVKVHPEARNYSSVGTKSDLHR